MHDHIRKIPIQIQRLDLVLKSIHHPKKHTRQEVLLSDLEIHLKEEYNFTDEEEIGRCLKKLKREWLIDDREDLDGYILFSITTDGVVKDLFGGFSAELQSEYDAAIYAALDRKQKTEQMDVQIKSNNMTKWIVRATVIMGLLAIAQLLEILIKFWPEIYAFF